jgi:hypothetical protein
MKLKYFCIFVLFLTANTCPANDKDYSICAVAGYYTADNNRLLTDLAERIAAKNNLFGDDKCTQALKDGKETGLRISKAGAVRTDQDYVIQRQAIRFSDLIYDSILSRVKF